VTITAVARIPGLVLSEHEFSVPLDHDVPEGERITVFAREVAEPDGLDRPFLVYLEGGPGHEAPRPTRRPSSPSWLDRALREFRVLMLDQRGTGRSSPIGHMQGLTPAEQAERMACFRADSIVRDAELIRAQLGVDRWSVLGQSFGGFCVTAYLSIAPGGLREALITGGLPAFDVPVDDVYAYTFSLMAARSRAYYERYPGDRERVRALAARLDAEDVRLPNGDRLTSRRLRQLGQVLGFSDGAERLHALLELPHDSLAFRHDVQTAVPYSRNPLYSLLQEACWADGQATRWAAERVRPPEYDDPEMFFGEHMFPWMLDDYGALAPLREAADLLAERAWPRLYDRARLAANEVPAAAVIYANDAYVPRPFSEQTAAQIGGLRTWLTDEYEHNGLRADGERILDRLLDLARGRA
jgi:pimeloyl-ACP methyl ester carboxylesterase